MYWIYLLIFIIIVFVPSLINKSYLFLTEEQLEEILIFFLGSLGFLLFIFKEKKLSQIIKEKLKIQRKSNLISQDLTNSYSYIGEMNRKMEILKDIFTKISDIRYGYYNKNKIEEVKKEVEKMILHAIAIFLGKQQKFCIKLINMEEMVTEKNLKNCRSFKNVTDNIDREELNTFFQKNNITTKKNYLEIKNKILIPSHQKINNYSVLLILNKNQMKYLDNFDIIGLLLTQLLFITRI